MVSKLNWTLGKLNLTKKLKPTTICILLALFTGFCATAQDELLDVLDTIVAKTNKIIIEEDTLPVYSVSVGKVGTVFPCGSRFGISLQAPGYHIFSGESAYNATFVPGKHEILWPEEEAEGEGGEKRNQVYQSTFERIKQMRVGTVEGSFGKRWTISAEQFQSNYSNLFNFDLDGKKLAGDYSNMFFEMLISIQELAKENDELKAELHQMEDRLTAIESLINSGEGSLVNKDIENDIKIYPNPSSGKTLNIEYSINTDVKKATLYIYDLNGKTLYKTPLKNRKTGNITQSVDLIPGVYFYQLSIDSNKGISHKLIIN